MRTAGWLATRLRATGLIAAGLTIALGVPAAAQQFVSESYTFLKAVRDRDGNKVQEMLDKPGTSVARSRDGGTGETALHIVAKRRDLTYLRVMLARGTPIDGRDAQGLTALAVAAQLGWTEGVQQLLDVGASVDLADNQGETPLILATQARSAPVVRLLVANGADPRKTDSIAGMSAVDYATRDGRSPELLRIFADAKPVAKKQVAGPSING